jgi:hypothetical protein
MSEDGHAQKCDAREEQTVVLVCDATGSQTAFLPVKTQTEGMHRPAWNLFPQRSTSDLKTWQVVKYPIFISFLVV